MQRQSLGLSLSPVRRMKKQECKPQEKEREQNAEQQENSDCDLNSMATLLPGRMDCQHHRGHSSGGYGLGSGLEKVYLGRAGKVTCSNHQ